MKKKVVYQDGDYTKVVYGAVEEDEHFLRVKNLSGETVIGKNFVISITDKEGD